jgi:hypothetical protein
MVIKYFQLVQPLQGWNGSLFFTPGFARGNANSTLSGLIERLILFDSYRLHHKKI